MPKAVQTPFSQWLDRELQRRSMSQADLARDMKRRPQVVYSWFNDGRVPSTELCADVARALHLSLELVLKQAGHIPAAYEVPEPAVPGWLVTVFEPEDPAQRLDPYELQVLEHTVVETARGLIQLREERARYGATPATPDEPPPAS